jgi:hypothetical protein
MYCLQTLTLDRALPLGGAPPVSVSEITMHALRRFHIWDSQLQCTRILCGLSTPHATLVKVVIEDSFLQPMVNNAGSLENFCKALTFCMASLSQPLSILECEGDCLVRFSAGSGKDAGPIVKISSNSRAITPSGQGMWFLLA